MGSPTCPACKGTGLHILADLPYEGRIVAGRCPKGCPTPPAPAEDAQLSGGLRSAVERLCDELGRILWAEAPLKWPEIKALRDDVRARLTAESRTADDAGAAGMPVAWALCFVPFGHDDAAAKPKLLFDTKDRAEDVARRQSAFGVAEGARFIVRPLTWVDALPLPASRESTVTLTKREYDAMRAERDALFDLLNTARRYAHRLPYDAAVKIDAALRGTRPEGHGGGK